MEKILTKAPFNLSDEQINFVEKLYEGMSLEERIGQLFLLVAGLESSEELENIIKKYNPGGFLYRPLPAKEIIKWHQKLISSSKIPPFLAANTESGGNGIINEGTMVGWPMQVGATRDSKYAYLLGDIATSELKAVGGNLSLAPLVDINRNFENPIVNLRAFGDSPDQIIEFGLNYLKAAHKNNIACTVKHFPGDGISSRDHHLHIVPNYLDMKNWDKTFGKVYQAMFHQGNTLAAMVGHFTMPNYLKEFRPNKSEDFNVPASFNKTILNDLLRDKLNFNGLIFTDSTLMSGMVAMIPRKELVPLTIANGADVCLFVRNLEEDFESMLNGYKNNIISEQRLQEACYRILGTKVKLGLFNEQKLDIENFNKIKNKYSSELEELRSEAITLVKDDQNILPLKNIKKILLYCLNSPIMNQYSQPVISIDKLKELFGEHGVEFDYVDYSKATILETLQDSLQPISVLKSKYDLIVYFARYNPGSMLTNLRLTWSGGIGPDVPKLIPEIPTIFISLGSPYHIFDVPDIKTFINAYSDDDLNLSILFAKLFGVDKRGFNKISHIHLETNGLQINFDDIDDIKD